VDESVDPAILEFIRATRDRYTREAITDRLQAAGHEPDAIQRAWQVSDADAPSATRWRRDWRPGWAEGLALVGLGAVGAYVVWRDEPYGAGGIAPFVYVGAASLAFGVGKGGSMLVDRDQRMWAAIGAGLIIASLLYVAVAAPPGAVGIGAFIGAFAFGAAVLALGFAHQRVSGFAGAALPILAWLVVTGVCYSPLIGR
jgi:hypothetical protein